MSIAATEYLPLPPVISHEDLHIGYLDADVILRSSDSYEFRVLKMYIVRSSPVLGEKVLNSPNPEPTTTTIPAGPDVDSPNPEPTPTIPTRQNVEDAAENALSAAQLPIAIEDAIPFGSLQTNLEPTPTIPAGPDVEDAAAKALSVVQLPIEGAVLFSLLTYIFPVTPVLPSTDEHVMELLSVAQLYQMDVVLTHIRNHITQREPPLIRKETAFLIYSLSLKHSLRPEALQAAECTLSFSSLTIEDLAKESLLDMMPGAFLHELWKYHQRVRSNLSLDLKEFETSDPLTIPEDCISLTDSSTPSWLESYISTIGTGRLPDLTDFHMALTEHGQDIWGWFRRCDSCSGISRESIRELWRALTTVVRGSISKVRVTHVPVSPE